MYAGDFKINVHLKGNELSPHAKNIQTGSADFCFELKGTITKFKADLESKDLAILEGIVPRSGVSGRMQSIYLRDPDGNLIEFCSYD